MNKRFLIIMAVIIAVFAGLVLFNKKDEASTSESGQVTSHVFGEATSGVTLMEYADFQCPACLSYFPIISQLKTEYADRVAFQFRHFPLVSSHQNAMAAHRAAEAASVQGKFWEMHDLLFAQQNSWKDSNNAAGIFEGYAQQIGLNVDQYKTDAASSTANANIQADFKTGQDTGVSGTPTFLINGEVIESPRSIEDFRKALDDAIAAQTTQE